MRMDEITRGVAVRDRTGRERGTSRAAGRRAVGLSIWSRVLYLVQPMVLPPLLIEYARRKIPFFTQARHGPLALKVATVLFVASMSAVATPMCIAIYPQESSVHVSKLEAKFRGMRILDEDGKEGELADTFVFNKGI
jgi:hypothetical protein